MQSLLRSTTIYLRLTHEVMVVEWSCRNLNFNELQMADLAVRKLK